MSIGVTLYSSVFHHSAVHVYAHRTHDIIVLITFLSDESFLLHIPLHPSGLYFQGQTVILVLSVV